MSQRRTLTIDGKTQTLQDWSDETQQPYQKLYSRVLLGWTDSEVISGRTSRRLTIDGVTKSIQSWADEVSVRYSVIYHRLRNGWSDREAVFGKGK